jgi:hypothetical protein
MAISNEEKLKKLLYLMDEDSMTKQDFIKEWKKVLDLVKKIKDENVQAIRDMKEAHLKLSAKIDDNSNQNLTKISKDFTEKIKDLEKRYSDFMADIELRVAEIQDGQDGKDADEEIIVGKVLNKIRIPEIDEIEKDLPKLGEPIRDALELLEGDNRLMISAIKGLEEKLQELGERPLGGKGGGGFSYAHMDRHFIDDETPSGLVNGSNKAFTIAKTPNPTASLKVYVNGQRMRITEDYTLSARTITFVTAPPTGSIVLVDYRF